MRVAVVGVPGPARSQPGRTKAEGADGRVRRGCPVTLGIHTNQAAEVQNNNTVGSGMQKAVSGLRLVHVARKLQTADTREATAIREATTGRPVAVPRIWAVAEPARVPAQPKPAAATREIP